MDDRARALGVLQRYRWPLLAVSIFGLAAELVGLIMPLIPKVLLDRVYPSRDLQAAHLLIALSVLLGLGVVALSAGRTIASGRLRARIRGDATTEHYARVLSVPRHLLRSWSPGALYQRAEDLRRSRTETVSLFQSLTGVLVQAVSIPALLFFLDRRLALLIVAAVPASALWTVYTANRMRPLWKRQEECKEPVTDHSMLLLRDLDSIQSNGLHEGASDMLRPPIATLHAVEADIAKTGGQLGVVGGSITALTTGGIAWVGWVLVLRDQLLLGELFAMTAYAQMLQAPLRTAIQAYARWQQIEVFFSRSQEIATLAGARPQSAPVVAGHSDNACVLRGVTFGYGGAALFRGWDLTLVRGSTSVVTGRSGVGKTSLLRLVTGLEVPQAGRIAVLGYDPARLPLTLLQREMAAVWSHSELWPGSLLGNLTLGCARVSRSRVIEVCEMFDLDDVLGSSGIGLERVVLDWTEPLSSGQRQRVLLARAVLKRPSVVVLDEPTAALDNETTRRVLEGLRQLAHQGATIILSAHDPIAADYADGVLHLERLTEGTVEYRSELALARV